MTVSTIISESIREIYRTTKSFRTSNGVEISRGTIVEFIDRPNVKFSEQYLASAQIQEHTNGRVQRKYPTPTVLIWNGWIISRELVVLPT